MNAHLKHGGSRHKMMGSASHNAQPIVISYAKGAYCLAGVCRTGSRSKRWVGTIGGRGCARM